MPLDTSFSSEVESETKVDRLASGSPDEELSFDFEEPATHKLSGQLATIDVEQQAEL